MPTERKWSPRDLTGRLTDVVNTDSQRFERNRHRTFSFLWRLGDASIIYRVENGRITADDYLPAITDCWDFSLTAPVAVWNRFLGAKPAAPFHHLFGLWAREPSFTVDGNRMVLVQHAAFVNRMMEWARWVCTNGESPRPDTAAGPISGDNVVTGSYRKLDLPKGTTTTIYVETAGTGQDILLLHTAGSDSRQFHGVMNDARLIGDWRLTAFDLPGHGKSYPAGDWWNSSYNLALEDYCGIVTRFVEASRLDRPIVIGCSMAGAVCLELALKHPSAFGGVIACEAAERIPGRLNEWLRHPQVDSAEFAPQWIDGLMSPFIAPRNRQAIRWCYSQSGQDIFFGDVSYYSGSFDISGHLSEIDTAACPVFMLTGEYDYSCTPAMSKATANKIPGATFVELTGMGHFPMAEDPDAFVSRILPILQGLRRP